MYYKQLVLLTALFFNLFSGLSQTREIDSLTIQLAFQEQDSLKIDTSLQLIKSLLNSKNYTKAILYINQSEKLAKELNYTNGIAELNYFRAQIFAKNKDYKNAIEYYSESLNYFNQKNDSLGIAKVNNSIGLIHIKLGNYTQGLNYSLSAITIFEKKNLKQELSIAYNNLAEAYFNTYKLEKSLEYNQKALDVRKDLNDINGIIASTKALANIYSLKKEHRKAIEYYENALTFLNIKENDTLRGEILPNIGREYMQFNEYSNSSKYLLEAITLNKKINSKKGILKSYIYLSELNLKLNKIRLAVYQINEAYKRSREVADDNLNLETYRVLIDVNSYKADYKNAFLWQSEYYKLKTKLDSEKDKILNKISAEETPLVIPNREPVIIPDTTLNTETSDLKIKKLKLLIYSLIALISILLITLFFLSKSNKKKQNYISNFNSNSGNFKNENIELKEKLVNLEEINQVKNRLFSIVSHDLKDSISSIKSFIDLLKDKGISQDEFEQLLPELSENADNASTLLLNLLNWSKSQMQNLDPKAEYFDIKEVFNEKMNLISKKAAKKQIVLLNDSVKEIIYADKNMIEIVIQNLLANAVKFSRIGDVITVSNRQRNGNALICIADTGVGISEENQKKLFTNEGFTTRGTDHEKGTGLGLSICKQLVDLNKGKIWVESEPNFGSKFYIELPKEKN